MSQFLEVLEWFDESGQEMVHRFEPGGEIKLGAKLVVREGQSAVFFKDGRALDAFAPGRHTLTTKNIPLLTKVLSIPFGGTSPFRADVYFVSRKVFLDLRWGTREPVVFRDSAFDLVRLRAHGVFATRVAEPRRFVNEVVGSMGSYSTERIESYLRDLIVARLNDVLGETLRSVLDLPKSYDELAAALRSRAHEDFSRYGLDLTALYIGAIVPPEDVQKIIDERSGMAAIGADHLAAYARFKAARAMGDAATAGGGSGDAAGAGLGLGMGAALGVQMMEAMRAGGAPAAAATICASCSGSGAPGARICIHCGASSQAAGACAACGGSLPSGAKFCPACGSRRAP